MNYLVSALSFLFPSTKNPEPSFALTLGCYAVKLTVHPQTEDWIDLCDEVVRQAIYFKFPICEHPLVHACAQLLRYYLVPRRRSWW
uniref:Uncharacterized protein n=1 Tax=viral metagenome TaxID=1070528 RepID=A0A6C0BNA5_9ZZZZ